MCSLALSMLLNSSQAFYPWTSSISTQPLFIWIIFSVHLLSFWAGAQILFPWSMRHVVSLPNLGLRACFSDPTTPSLSINHSTCQGALSLSTPIVCKQQEWSNCYYPWDILGVREILKGQIKEGHLIILPQENPKPCSGDQQTTAHRTHLACLPFCK